MAPAGQPFRRPGVPGMRHHRARMEGAERARTMARRAKPAASHALPAYRYHRRTTRDAVEMDRGSRRRRRHRRARRRGGVNNMAGLVVLGVAVLVLVLV